MNFHCRKLNSLVSVHPPTTARLGLRFTVWPFAFFVTKVLSREVLMCRAICWTGSSQEISSQWSEPGRRTLGVRIRLGLSMSYLSVAPFGHSVPRLVGASGSPSTCTTVDLTFFALSPSVWTMTPHATAQYGQMLRVSVVRAILSCRISARACEMSNPIPTAAPATAAPFKNVRRFIEPPRRFGLGRASFTSRADSGRLSEPRRFPDGLHGFLTDGSKNDQPSRSVAGRATIVCPARQPETFHRSARQNRSCSRG